MDNLLERTRSKLTTGPDTPPWWPIVQIGLGLAFAVYLLASLGGSEQAPPAGTAGQFGQPPVGAPTVAPTAPPTGPGAPDPTTPEPTTPPAGGTVKVAAADGSGKVAVAKAAKATADAAATAMYTGDFSRVPFVPGTTAPPSGATWDAPELLDATVRQLRTDLLQFVYTVDPDGDGPESPRQATVHVADVDGTWALRGA